MRNTATKSAQEVRQQTTASPATTQQNQQQQKPKDAFDEINEKPNTSKAYLKRAGK